MSIDYDHFDFEISKCARYHGVHPGVPAALGMAKSPRCRGGIWRSSLSYYSNQVHCYYSQSTSILKY